MENYTARLVSIDAWRDGDGWTWNNQFAVSVSDPAAMLSACETDRKLLRYLRKEGVLTPRSAGRVRVDRAHSEPNYIEIQDRHTGEPLVCVIVESEV